MENCPCNIYKYALSHVITFVYQSLFLNILKNIKKKYFVSYKSAVLATKLKYNLD